MPYIELTADQLRTSRGEVLDRVIGGSCVKLSRYGRTIAAILPWSLAELVPPDADPSTCSGCAARWVGPSSFCPSCGHPTNPSKRGKKPHASS